MSVPDKQSPPLDFPPPITHVSIFHSTAAPLPLSSLY